MQEHVTLAEYTTLNVGGPARFFAAVTNESELTDAVAYAKEHGLHWRVLGGGSNVLVPDEGFDGLVIHNCITKRTAHEVGDSVRVVVGSGEVFDEIVAWTVAEGWWGLENLSHIPGFVGATPVQNVGAYGVEVKDVIESVRVLDTTDQTYKELTVDECSFAYRDSIFKHEAGSQYVITSVTFTLQKNAQPNVSYRDLQKVFTDQEPTLQAVRDAVIVIRSKKFPDWNVVGTAGSFFKNPIVTNEVFAALKDQYQALPGFPVDGTHTKIPLAWILDNVLLLKGITKGAVGAYEGQALVLTNVGGATANEIITFAEEIVARVQNEIGIAIEWEVTRW